MTKHTRHLVESVINELKRDGSKVLMIIFDANSDESLPMGSAMEVLCSETNDPKLLAAMAKTALEEMKGPQCFGSEADRLKSKFQLQ